MIEPNKYSERMQILALFIFIIFGLWLTILSAVLFRMWSLFTKLTKGVEVTDLKKVLEKVLDQEDSNQSEISEIKKKISWLESDGKLHMQKVGLTRFNPFKELGGDHSFSLAILNSEDSGIIITSLHTRDRTRVYMKGVVAGKSDSELSADERKALDSAKK